MSSKKEKDDMAEAMKAMVKLQEQQANAKDKVQIEKEINEVQLSKDSPDEGPGKIVTVFAAVCGVISSAAGISKDNIPLSDIFTTAAFAKKLDIDTEIVRAAVQEGLNEQSDLKLGKDWRKDEKIVQFLRTMTMHLGFSPIPEPGVSGLKIEDAVLLMQLYENNFTVETRDMALRRFIRDSASLAPLKEEAKNQAQNITNFKGLQEFAEIVRKDPLLKHLWILPKHKTVAQVAAETQAEERQQHQQQQQGFRGPFRGGQFNNGQGAFSSGPVNQVGGPFRGRGGPSRQMRIAQHMAGGSYANYNGFYSRSRPEATSDPTARFGVEDRARVKLALGAPTTKAWFHVQMPNGKQVVALGDSGADVSVASKQFTRNHGLPVMTLETSDIPVLRTADAQKLDVVGATWFRATVGRQVLEVTAYVVNADVGPAGLLMGFHDLIQASEVTLGKDFIRFGASGENIPLVQHARDKERTIEVSHVTKERPSSSILVVDGDGEVLAPTPEESECFVAAVIQEWDDVFDAEDSFAEMSSPEAKLKPSEDEVWKEFAECFGPMVPQPVRDRIVRRCQEIAKEGNFVCWKSSKDKSPVPLSNAPPLEVELKEDVVWQQPRSAKVHLNEEDERVRTGLLDMMKEGGWIDYDVRPRVCSPVIVAHAPGREARAVADFRVCNAMTKDEHNAAPFTPAEIAEKLARKGQFYSSADGSKQYNQYPIAEKSKRIMGLDFGGGRIVAANRMMLGIKQAPAHHQWWFNQIIPAPWEIYMDDLPVAHVGTTMEEKLASLERDIVELARVMTKYRHTISLAKCKFGYEALDILGLRVEKGTVVPGSKVSQRLASLTEPKTREEAERFIASANAWRKHYANFARPEAVIRDALKGLEKGDRLPRTKEVREAIAEIKTGLEKAYNTFYPAKKGGTMIVQTDFSESYGVGAYLAFQTLGKEEDSELIAGGSFRLNAQERKRVKKLTDELYVGLPEGELARAAAPEGELRTFLRAFREVKHLMLLADRIEWHTDSLTQSFVVGKPGIARDPATMRALAELAPYNIVAVHCKVPETDLLTRDGQWDRMEKNRWVRGGETPKDVFIEKEDGQRVEKAVLAVSAEAKAVVQDWWRQALDDGDFGSQLSEFIAAAEDVRNAAPEHVRELDPVLTQSQFIAVVPPGGGERVMYVPLGAPRVAVLRSAHDSNEAGHGSAKFMVEYMQKFYYWPGMKQDAEKWAKECAPCQKARVFQKQKGMNPKPAKAAGDDWQVDTAKLEAGKALTVLMDEGSELVLARLVEEGSADTALAAFSSMLDDVQPKKLTLDGGAEWQGNFKEEVERRGIALNVSSPDDPSAHGAVENKIGQLKSIMAKLSGAKQEKLLAQGLAKQDQDGVKLDWDAIADVALDAVNHRKSAALEATPMEVYDAVKPPTRVLEEALGIAAPDGRSLEERNQDRERDEEASMEQKNKVRQEEKEHFDAARRKKELEINEGDLVWKKRVHYPRGTTKMERKRDANEGVYKVLRVFPGGRSVSLGIEGAEGFVAFPKISKRLLAKVEKQEVRQQLPAAVAEVLQGNTALDSDFPQHWSDKKGWYSPGVWERLRIFRLRRLRNRMGMQAEGQRRNVRRQSGGVQNRRVRQAGFRNLPREQQAVARQQQQADRRDRAQARAR